MVLLLTDLQRFGVVIIVFAVAVVVVGALIGLLGKTLMKR